MLLFSYKILLLLLSSYYALFTLKKEESVPTVIYGIGVMQALTASITDVLLLSQRKKTEKLNGLLMEQNVTSSIGAPNTLSAKTTDVLVLKRLSN